MILGLFRHVDQQLETKESGAKSQRPELSHGASCGIHSRVNTQARALGTHRGGRWTERTGAAEGSAARGKQRAGHTCASDTGERVCDFVAGAGN